MFLLSKSRTLYTRLLCEEKKRRNISCFHHHEETSKEDALEEKETRREYCLISSLSVSLITREYTWMIDNGASKNMSWFKGVISNLKEKQFACMVEMGENSKY